MVWTRLLPRAACGIILAICAGCAEEAARHDTVKHFDETITDAEWKQFERVAEDLGDNGLADLATVFPPLPDWQATDRKSVV